jgi:L-threonylcarbamoyladenylate synthase
MSENPHIPIDPILLARARAMRSDPAPAEKKLWKLLRNRQLCHLKFRRQVPVGAFIVDFVCHEAMLIVELDGESHGTRSNEDALRTSVLEREGYHVIRFWNPDVFDRIEAVLRTIAREASGLLSLSNRTGVRELSINKSLAATQNPHPNPLPNGEGIRSALALLRAGELVAMPTETVYGLAADATNFHAVEKIFALKGRPSTNPLIVHVASVDVAKRYITHWPDTAQQLADAFWPGPLTIVLPVSDAIAKNVTAGLSTVGIRIPNHPLALDLLTAFDGPLAAPSANKSNHVSPTTAQHVRTEFGDALSLVLDGGPCTVGIESTIIDLTQTYPHILRPGSITPRDIQYILQLPITSGITNSIVASTHPASIQKSPGQLPVHYAPQTPAYRFETHERNKISLTDAAIIDLSLDPESYARLLYARLRMLDTQHLRAIYIEIPPDTTAWHAVRDRVMRATRSLQA